MNNMIWDLDCFFKKNFESSLCELKIDVEKFEKAIATENMSRLLKLHERLEARINEALSYTHCLLAQDVEDLSAQKWNEEASLILSSYHSVKVAFDERLAKLSKENFDCLVTENEELTFLLEERRRLAKRKLDFEKEKMIELLAVDGYHGWSEIYKNLSGKMKITSNIFGEVKTLSVAQAYNYLHHANREIRKAVFKDWENAYHCQKELFATFLNRIAGFRLKTYSLRGWSSFLEEPLEQNCIDLKTLTTMWEVIDAKKDILTAFLKAKAKFSGLKKLEWHDVEVPTSKIKKALSYEQGSSFVLEHFSTFSDNLGDYAKEALKQHTIDAEERPNKMPGGFCTPFPVSKTSRIFMTWSNTQENLLTLAHELGHGFHNNRIFSFSPFACNYPMCLAETASIFAEQIVSEGMLNQLSQKEERLQIIEERAIRSVLFLMNIRCRYLFETQFYEKRAKGILPADELSELMVSSQKVAFNNSLETYHPYFWASKQHFYLSDRPFYNFPYTFGYLFSLGIYALAKESPKAFAPKYEALLQDTWRMNVKDLAQKHLGVDLTKVDFWEKAVDLALDDAKNFVKETAE